MKRGTIALARRLCVEIAGYTDDDQDESGSDYGSVDIAEILSAEVERLREEAAMNWQPTTSLPKPNEPVLAYVQNSYSEIRGLIIRAQHAPAKTLEQSIDCEGGEYDEETGTYWCLEGWYETNCFDEINWRVDGVVNHWMPLPKKP